MSLDNDDYDFFVKQACANFDEHGAHIPIVFAMSKDAMSAIPLDNLLTENVPRELTFAVLRHLLQAIGADSYVMISEGWQAASKAMPPSENPDRVEVLQIFGVWGSGRKVGTIVTIENGKITGKPEALLDTATGYMVSGGFADLLTGNVSTPIVESLAAKIAKEYRDQIMRN